MSNIINITVVMDNEKQHDMPERENRESIILTHDSSMTVMSTLLKNGLIQGSFCGGRGDCGRCRIQFLSGAAMPTAIERSVMEPEELRQGYRLACLARPKDSCVIKLAMEDETQLMIVADMIPMTDKNDHISQHIGQTIKQKPDVIEFDGKEAIIAVDLGTTTIVMQLVELNTGRLIDTYCGMNPQRRYGADVLSRIKASCEGSGEALQHCVAEVLEQGVSRFRKCLAGRR